MKPTTYKLLNIITYIVIFTSYALEGTCVYGQGSRKMQMTCWIIFGVCGNIPIFGFVKPTIASIWVIKKKL